MTTLTDFLLARIAEDERAASDVAWVDVPDRHLGTVSDCDCGEDHAPATYLAADPARVLAECKAKRQIVEDLDSNEWQPLRYLAAVYADHPDYDEEWRP